jgi:hypothetical protein
MMWVWRPFSSTSMFTEMFATALRDVELARGAADTLRSLHEEFMAAFEAGERTA